MMSLSYDIGHYTLNPMAQIRIMTPLGKMHFVYFLSKPISGQDTATPLYLSAYRHSLRYARQAEILMRIINNLLHDFRIQQSRSIA